MGRPVSKRGCPRSATGLARIAAVEQRRRAGYPRRALAKVAQQRDDRPFREQLDDLEESIEMLKVAYERYFNGVDKIPPRREHDKIDRRVRMMMREVPRTTAMRFRFNSLKARLVTYNQYWTRILRQIENGTFKRLMSEQARRDRESKMNAEAARDKLRREMERAAAEEPGDGAEQPAAGAPGRPAAGGARRRPTTGPQKPATLPDGMSAGEARQLFKQFVQAKKAAGESTTGITYGALVKKLAREVPKLKQKHGSKVSFEVTTVDGKVRLRARRGSA